jgi:integrase
MGRAVAKNITKAKVDALTPGAILWDGKVKGFGVRYRQRAKFYMLKCRITGRARWLTIGRPGSPWTVEKARAKARMLLGEIAAGRDPATARDDERAAGTFAEFAARYLTEHAATNKKPRSVVTDRINLDLNILPALGSKRFTEIARDDIKRLHHGLRHKPGAANRCLSLLSKMFNLAEAWGVRPDGTNPVRHIERYPERKMERFLSAAEMGRIGAVLERAETERIVPPRKRKKGKGENREGGENIYVIAAVRLLMLTGARRSEILTAKWEYFKPERAVLELPDSKTGAKVIALGSAALVVLESLPRLGGNPYILPGHVGGQNLINIDAFWQAVCKEAHIGSCRLHDLRHSFASVGAASGDSLLLLGKLLGHSQPQTTARYSHLSDDPVRAAANRISSEIEARLTGRPDAKVSELGRRGA